MTRVRARRGRRRSRCARRSRSAWSATRSNCRFTRQPRRFPRLAARSLSDRKDEGFDLLRLALTAPRFDAEPVERIRAQMLTALRRETTNPNDIASRGCGGARRFPDHPYGRPINGTLEIGAAASRATTCTAYARRVLARDKLKIGVVGDIDAATLGALLDRVFGSLPGQGAICAACRTRDPQSVGKPHRRSSSTCRRPWYVRRRRHRRARTRISSRPSSSTIFWAAARSRRGSTAKCARSAGWPIRSIPICCRWIARRCSWAGPQTRADKRRRDGRADRGGDQAAGARAARRAEELDKAKSYLKGSYRAELRHLHEDRGAACADPARRSRHRLFERRNGLIDAVTLDDVKRVAKRLLDGGVLITVVGRAAGRSRPSRAAERNSSGNPVELPSESPPPHGRTDASSFMPIHRT